MFVVSSLWYNVIMLYCGIGIIEVLIYESEYEYMSDRIILFCYYHILLWCVLLYFRGYSYREIVIIFSIVPSLSVILSVVIIYHLTVL